MAACPNCGLRIFQKCLNRKTWSETRREYKWSALMESIKNIFLGCGGSLSSANRFYNPVVVNRSNHSRDGRKRLQLS